MAATYEPIASQTLSSATGTVTFSSIPSTYTDLLVVGAYTYTGGPAGGEQLLYRVNGDTGTNYSVTTLTGNGSTASSSRNANLNVFATHAGSGADSGTQIQLNVALMSYANTNVFKTVLSATTWPAFRVDRMVGLWRNQAAITSLTFFTTYSLAAGSTFSLFGLAAA